MCFAPESGSENSACAGNTQVFDHFLARKVEIQEYFFLAVNRLNWMGMMRGSDRDDPVCTACEPGFEDILWKR